MSKNEKAEEELKFTDFIRNDLNKITAKGLVAMKVMIEMMFQSVTIHLPKEIFVFHEESMEFTLTDWSILTRICECAHDGKNAFTCDSVDDFGNEDLVDFYKQFESTEDWSDLNLDDTDCDFVKDQREVVSNYNFKYAKNLDSKMIFKNFDGETNKNEKSPRQVEINIGLATVAMMRPPAICVSAIDSRNTSKVPKLGGRLLGCQLPLNNRLCNREREHSMLENACKIDEDDPIGFNSTDVVAVASVLEPDKKYMYTVTGSNPTWNFWKKNKTLNEYINDNLEIDRWNSIQVSSEMTDCLPFPAGFPSTRQSVDRKTIEKVFKRIFGGSIHQLVKAGKGWNRLSADDQDICLLALLLQCIDKQYERFQDTVNCAKFLSKCLQGFARTIKDAFPLPGTKRQLRWQVFCLMKIANPIVLSLLDGNGRMRVIDLCNLGMSSQSQFLETQGTCSDPSCFLKKEPNWRLITDTCKLRLIVHKEQVTSEYGIVWQDYSSKLQANTDTTFPLSMTDFLQKSTMKLANGTELFNRQSLEWRMSEEAIKNAAASKPRKAVWADLKSHFAKQILSCRDDYKFLQKTGFLPQSVIDGKLKISKDNGPDQQLAELIKRCENTWKCVSKAEFRCKSVSTKEAFFHLGLGEMIEILVCLALSPYSSKNAKLAISEFSKICMSNGRSSIPGYWKKLTTKYLNNQDGSLFWCDGDCKPHVFENLKTTNLKDKETFAAIVNEEADLGNYFFYRAKMPEYQELKDKVSSSSGLFIKYEK